jgi:hypothetical protein
MGRNSAALFMEKGWVQSGRKNSDDEVALIRTPQLF